MRKGNKVIGVSQKAIVANVEGKILAIRRSKTHPRRPLGWDIPGGDLEFGEDTREGITREIKEETGLDVGDLKVVDAGSWTNDAGEFWVTICYYAAAKSDKVELSWEHGAFQWLTAAEFLQTDALPRIKNFVANFVARAKNLPLK